MSQKTMFKVLALSYLRHRQQKDLFQDCIAATSGQIQLFKQKVSIQLSDIKQALDLPININERPLNMSVIEQETQRSQGDQQPREQISMSNSQNYQDSMIKRFTKEFNQKIQQLKKVQYSFDELLSIYKEELKGLARQMCALKDNNKAVIKKLDQKNQQCLVLKKQIKRLKLQDKQEQQRVWNSPQKENNIKRGNCKLNNPDQKGDQKHQKQSEAQQRQKMKQKQKWRNLSIKVQTYRKKLQLCQKQIQEKDETIKGLSEKLSRVKESSDDQQKKKLKASNTNLRGQKILQSNQIVVLKKQILDKCQLIEAQDLQLKKLKLQLENLSSTLKWQTNTIQDLRNDQKSDLGQHKVQKDRIYELEDINRNLLQAISEQQTYLESLNSKISQLDTAHQQEIKRYKKKISEYEIILQEKNQSIINLRANSNKVQRGKRQDNAEFYIELVQVMKKKLFEKQERVRVLESQLKFHS